MFAVEELQSLIDYERWQDLVLAAGNVFFCFTLIPMLRHPVGPPLLTCIPTGLALLIGRICVRHFALVAHGADANRHPDCNGSPWFSKSRCRKSAKPQGEPPEARSI